MNTIQNKVMNRLGFQNNPIYLLQDDDETKEKFDEQLQIARNKTLLEQSQLTNQPIQICFAICKTKVKGDLVTKNKALNRAIIDFFQQYLKIKITSQHFYPKIQADYSNPQTVPLKNQLVLHGVDFLSTSAIKDRLQTNQVNIQKIIWINDSNCKIVLSSDEDAQKLIRTHSLQIKVQEDDQQLNAGWISIKPYIIYNFQRQLSLRYATNSQNLPQKQSSSNYMAYLEVKNSLPINLLQKFNAYDDYVSFVRQTQRKIYEQKRQNNFKKKSRSRSRQNKNWNRNRSYEKRNFGERQQYRGRDRIYHAQAERSNRTYLLEQSTPLNQPNQSITYNIADKGIQNLDYSYIQSSKSQVAVEQNNKLDTSFKVSIFSKSKNIPQQKKSTQINPQKKISYDKLSNYDSELSFNDFGAPIATIDNVLDRLDYIFDAQSNHSVTDELADIFGNINTTKAVGRTLLDSSFQINGINSKEDKNDDLSFNNHQKVYKKSNLDFSIEIDSKRKDKSFNSSEKSSTDYNYKMKDVKSIKKPIDNYDYDY